MAARKKVWTSFTPEEDKFIIDNYRTMPVFQIASSLNRPKGGVRYRMKSLKLKTPAEVIRSVKLACLQNGYKKPPPGKVYTYYDQLRDTWTMLIRSNRFPEKNYGIELMSTYLYETNFGPIPYGMVVSYLDGDRLNCNPSNLVLKTRSEIIQEVSFNHLPDDVKATIRLINKIKRMDHEKETRQPSCRI